MSSVFFQFYYDDGSIRPFDADVAFEENRCHFEAPSVTTDGLIDIFELTPDDLQEAGLIETSFQPAFIKEYREIAEADGAPLESVGVEPNIYWENATIAVEPLQLKSWAQSWLQRLRSMDDSQRKEVLRFNWTSADEILKSLGALANQAECAQAHQVGIMLFIAW